MLSVLKKELWVFASHRQTEPTKVEIFGGRPYLGPSKKYQKPKKKLSHLLIPYKTKIVYLNIFEIDQVRSILSSKIFSKILGIFLRQKKTTIITALFLTLWLKKISRWGLIMWSSLLLLTPISYSPH